MKSRKTVSIPTVLYGPGMVGGIGYLIGGEDVGPLASIITITVN